MGSGGSEDSISMRRAASATFLLETDTELEHVILPSSCEPENLKPSTY